MKNNVIMILFLSIIIIIDLNAQPLLLPLEHGLNNRIRVNILESKSFHSSIQPYDLFYLDNKNNIDSVLLTGRTLTSETHSWFNRKLFREHLISFEGSDYSLFADFLPDFQWGYNIENNRSSYLNTRGFIFGGSVLGTFSFYTEFYETQSKFPVYVNEFIRKNSIVPGQGFVKFYGKNAYDYSQSSAVLSYQPSKYFALKAGHGKNFIGDGYRSFLLSDIAFNYPYLKLTATLDNIKYFSMWAEFENIITSPGTESFEARKKSGVFHYLDIHLTKNITVGLFEGIIWSSVDSTNPRGFEWNYLNPIIFLRPVDFSIGSPGNVLLGMNAKVEASSSTNFYGQFILDEMTVNEFISNKGYWGNKYAIQLGGYSSISVHNQCLFLRCELNLASPYTFSHKNVLKNYGHYNQPLAHPLGANFYEGVGILEYSLQNIESRIQINYYLVGFDSASSNSIGQDIYRSYNLRVSDYGNSITQGIKTRIFFANAVVAYILNPLSNLRFEGSLSYRSVHSGGKNSQNLWFSIGLRSSFRNLYYDFL